MPGVIDADMADFELAQGTATDGVIPSDVRHLLCAELKASLLMVSFRDSMVHVKPRANLAGSKVVPWR